MKDASRRRHKRRALSRRGNSVQTELSRVHSILSPGESWRESRATIRTSGDPPLDDSLDLAGEDVRVRRPAILAGAVMLAHSGCAHRAMVSRVSDSAVEAAIVAFIRVTRAPCYAVAVDGRDASAALLAALRRRGIPAVAYSSGAGSTHSAFISVSSAWPGQHAEEWVIVTNQPDYRTTRVVSFAWSRCLYKVSHAQATPLECEYSSTE
jgi:hypothetical protein